MDYFKNWLFIPFSLSHLSRKTSYVTFQTLVDNRQTGSSEISVGMSSFDNLTVDGGAAASDKDLIRVGYTITNPSK